jgi:phage terminase Nu1 subunit (DNA packaging protein)
VSEPNPTAAAQLTPDQAERIRAATISNIVKKIKKGGTPTVAEQKLLEEATEAPSKIDLKMATCTATELAEMFGYDKRRIEQFADEGVVVRVARGNYSVWDSIRGIVHHRETKRKNQWDGDPNSPFAADYDQERALLTRAKREIAEIEADLRKAQVHDAGAVMAVWADMISNAKAKLLSMPTTLAGRVHGEESLEAIRNLIEEAVNQSLNELAEYDPSLATDRYVQSHSGSVETPAEVDDEPMGGQPPKAVKRSKRRARAMENEPS